MRLSRRVSRGLTQEGAAPAPPDQLGVGTYDVENLDPTDDQAKLDRLAEGVVTNMGAPDVVGLEEIQDNTGAANDGTVASDVTLRRFVDAIVAAGGPRYEFRVIDPENNQDGGRPGGNIRVAFLFNPARVSFADHPGGDATTAVQAVAAPGGAALSVSPGHRPAEPGPGQLAQAARRRVRVRRSHRVRRDEPLRVQGRGPAPARSLPTNPTAARRSSGSSRHGCCADSSTS